MNSVKDKSILVLDDDIAMLRALARVLTEEGAIISKASSLEEALRYLSGNDGTFDLVITDLSVRDISGTGVLEALKAKLPEVPILVITAFGNPELRAQCLLQGAADFLEKPLNAVDLIAGISRVLASCGNRVQLAAPCVREVR